MKLRTSGPGPVDGADHMVGDHAVRRMMKVSGKLIDPVVLLNLGFAVEQTGKEWGCFFENSLTMSARRPPRY